MEEKDLEACSLTWLCRERGVDEMKTTEAEDRKEKEEEEKKTEKRNVFFLSFPQL